MLISARAVLTRARWARVTLAAALLLGVELTSLIVIVAIADYAGRDRPGDEGFDSLGRALMAFVIGAGVGILVALIAAGYAARIVRCATPKSAALVIIGGQLLTVIGLAALRFPIQLIDLSALAIVPALLWACARYVPKPTVGSV